MVDAHFNSFLTWRATFQKPRQATASSATYGQRAQQVTLAPEIIVRNVRCRLAPLTMREQINLRTAGTIVGEYHLFLLPQSMPTGLDMQRGSPTFQVINLKNPRGQLQDPGPFDILSVDMPGGVMHHYELMLKRVT